jgi:O-antigen/teichoic acid export membrane protein
MPLARNFLAGLSGSLISAAIGFAAVPIYLHLLGVEVYGLIGFYLTLQALLQVFDLGLTATTNREVARARAGPSLQQAAELVATLAWVAWTIAALIAASLFMLSPAIATHWLQLGRIDASDAVVALALMALALGLRWPVGFYQSVLLGSERVAHCSLVNALMTVFAHAGAAAMLWFIAADVRVFFAWQALSALLHVLWMRNSAWRSLPGSRPRRPVAGCLAGVGSFSLTMAGVGAIGLVFMQTDKLILSRILPLDLFGQYMLASLLAGGLYTLVTPAFNAIYPRFSRLAAAGQETALHRSYRDVTHLLACLLLPVAMFLAISAQGLLALWTSDSGLAASVAPVVAMLSIGSALHGVMFVPYAMTLSLGAAGLALRINLVLLLALGPLMLFLTFRFGPPGAAAAWLLLHLAYVVGGGWVTNTALMPKTAKDWLLVDVGVPAAVCLALGLAGRALIAGHFEPWSNVFAGLAMCSLAWVCLWAMSPRLRQALRVSFLQSFA